MIRTSLLFVGLMAASVTSVSCTKPVAAPAKQVEVVPTVDVEVAAVEVRPMPKIATTLGNVIADRQSEVAANVSGRVILAAVERGQAVKLGETLVMVDSRAANLSASAASAQLQLAETQAQQGHADCSRAEALLAQGAMGQAEYDRLRSQCKAQGLQANAAHAQAALSSKLAADALVRAPFSGVVGERYVSVGEYVQPQTRVASIYSLDPVRVIVSIPERAVALVKKGIPVEIEVAAWPGRSFAGTVAYVSPTLRPVQRDLLVEALAPNADGALRPGMFATVQVSLGDESVPTVPDDAIVKDGTVNRLYLTRDGQAFEMVVRIGVSHDGRTAVLDELADKAAVIRHPPPSLRDGTKVRVVNADGERSHASAVAPTPPADR